MNNKDRLSILTFPQRIDNGTFSLNILIVPQLSISWDGNPLLDMPLDFPNAGDMGAPLAAANLTFEARIISDLSVFPVHDPVDQRVKLQTMETTPDAAAIYGELQNQFQIKNGIVQSDLAEQPKQQLFIKKYLPQTYRDAFHFTTPSVPEAVIDDSYQCAIKADTKPNPAFQESPPDITWGKVYAYCLRHPLLARRLGLVREAQFQVDDEWFENGGFIFVTLRDDSDYAPGTAVDDHFNFIRHYAARIPALEPGASRPLFAANLFPVMFNLPPTGGFDQVFIDVADYDDGFSKIVHARQPVSQNLLEEEADGFPPLHDLGIQISWDDEKVLQWLNGQLKEREDMPGTGERLDAPLGVFAYRVDARLQGDGNWHSLVRVQSKNALQLGPVNLDTFTGELGVEVHPMQLDGDQVNGQFWLPSYFTSWNGESLVLPDEKAALVYHTEDDKNKAANLGRLYDALGLGDVELQYGNTYELRVRMMDITGGGPEVTHEAVHDAEAPVFTLHFKRYIKPEPLRVENIPLLPVDSLDTYFAGDTLTVRRPLLGYPAVVYTGKYADPIPLLKNAAENAAGQDSFGIADPDVLRVRIDVEVRTLLMDNKLSISREEAYIHLYTTKRDFPAGFDDPLDIPLHFVNANVLNFGNTADLGDLGVNENDLLALNEIWLPTGREIRLTLRAEGSMDTTYYDSIETAIGKPIQLKLRRESDDERDLLAHLSQSRQTKGIYLQPDPPQLYDGSLETRFFLPRETETPAMIQRLAQQLDVEQKGLTLVGEKGQRIIFGCSRRIRHTLAPDHSSITFASKDELLNHWIVALTFQVERDWTWDMVQEISFELFRKQWFSQEDEPADFPERPVGDLEMKRTAPINALQDADRSNTTLIFLDAVEPKSTEPNPNVPQGNVFPDTIELNYELRPRFRSDPTFVDDVELIQLLLPVTTPPAQVPRLASAGLALSPYVPNDDYSATEPRERYLWLEFEEPVKDPNNSLFIRLLGYGPDPLLGEFVEASLEAPEEPPIALDPELIRVITPGQSDDQAGLSAMLPLEPATVSTRHFLVPLPPGLHSQSSELFGFFTYELRVGHSKIWSTAQGRFGRPLRTTGVQHPSPALFCTCFRDEVKLSVEAPHAMAVLNGRNVTADPPRTELWALLYAQVRQADGKDNRNILLDERRLAVVPRLQKKLITAEGTVVTARGSERGVVRSAGQWSDAEIKDLLKMIGLPADASLSVLCVEMMPHLGSFFGTGGRTARANLAGSFLAGFGFSRGHTENTHQPLSDYLGHFRILRTSPLTAVPERC
ncbi:MAG: hypothetical protein ACK2UN_00090 [Candidatus Promineifilaceae bacterium]